MVTPTRTISSINETLWQSRQVSSVGESGQFVTKQTEDGAIEYASPNCFIDWRVSVSSGSVTRHEYFTTGPASFYAIDVPNGASVRSVFTVLSTQLATGEAFGRFAVAPDGTPRRTLQTVLGADGLQLQTVSVIEPAANEQLAIIRQCRGFTAFDLANYQKPVSVGTQSVIAPSPGSSLFDSIRSTAIGLTNGIYAVPFAGGQFRSVTTLFPPGYRRKALIRLRETSTFPGGCTLQILQNRFDQSGSVQNVSAFRSAFYPTFSPIEFDLSGGDKLTLDLEDTAPADGLPNTFIPFTVNWS